VAEEYYWAITYDHPIKFQRVGFRILVRLHCVDLSACMCVCVCVCVCVGIYIYIYIYTYIHTYIHTFI
jgi:hypothetical protein